MRYAWAAIIAVLVTTGSAAAEKTPPVNLLKEAPTAIRVSSTVANDKIRPYDIADGNLSTAWNSRTGKLVGEAIEIRVPATAWVNTIRMTVGFTMVDPKLGDLFVMNQRIKKVRVYRNGTLLKEHAFDVENRDLQSIPIEEAGGDFKIELAELLPGTKKNWREAAVSELEVLGTPSADEDTDPSASFYPNIDVGTLVAPAVVVKPYAQAHPPPVLVRIPTEKLVAIVVADGPRGFESRGEVIELDRFAKDKEDRVTALVRIVESPAQKKEWIGRRLQFHTAAATSCGGTIKDLAVYDHFYVPTGAASSVKSVIAAWTSGRPGTRGPLVALIEKDVGASCKNALWASAPGVKVARGTIDKKRYRKALLDAFLAGDGYRMIWEGYELNDLDGEDGPRDENEARIPEKDRLSPDLIRKTFDTAVGCIGTSCLGTVYGVYSGAGRSHVGFDILPIDSGKPDRSVNVSTAVVDAVLAAADVDGDGAVDLVFSAHDDDYVAHDPVTVVVRHTGSTTSVGLYSYFWTEY